METVGSRPIPTQAEWKQHLSGPDTICAAMYQLMDDLATLIPTAGTALTLSTSALTLPGNVTFTANVTMVLGASEALTLTCTDISAPLVMTNTMTTAGKTGCRALFEVDCNMVAGGWVNALKGYLKFGASGGVTGLASAINGELEMPSSLSGSAGTYACYEGNIVYPATGFTGGQPTSWFRLKTVGTDRTYFDDYGYLFDLQGLTGADTHMFDNAMSEDTSPAINATLRIRIGSTNWWLPLSDTKDCS